MYQYSTFTPLAGSKVYFLSIKECKRHLSSCVKMTEKFRKKEMMAPLQMHDIEMGQRLLKLSDDNLDEILKILGDQSDLSLNNLIKKIPVEVLTVS